MVDSLSHMTKLVLDINHVSSLSCEILSNNDSSAHWTIIFGGTEKIIEYLWNRNLLSNTKSCSR